MSAKKYKTGLVLSGGGARGFAHLGVMQALNEGGIYPDVISGASAGALAGVMYCDGYKPKEILKIMKASSRLDYMRPTLPRDGLLQITGIIKILETHLRAKTFEELKIPLFVSVTDINNAKAVYFSRGKILDIVIASASIPVLFKPVIINDNYYVDGGVLDNFPIRPIEGDCLFTIGSFVNPAGRENHINGLIKIAVRSFMLSMAREVMEKSKKFDLFIAPPELKNYGILDPDDAEEVYDIGYNTTKKMLKDSDIRKLISDRLSEGTSD